MTSQPFDVTIDDRARLMSAVLAATDWPDDEQNRKRYRAHAHARNTARRVAEAATHPAAQTLQTLLQQGVTLDSIFDYAFNLSWPDLTPQSERPWAPAEWPEQLADFFTVNDLASWWAEEADCWEQAVKDLQKIVADTNPYTFLGRFFGPLENRLVVMPNISYPGLQEVGARRNGAMISLVPPRVAWGDNDPWPFDEDPAHVFRGAMTTFGRQLMEAYLRTHAAAVAPLATTPLPVGRHFSEANATWGEQLTHLFASATTAIFLEETVGHKEAQAYMLMEERLRNMSILSGVVRVLKRYLAEHEQGRYREFIDYLPHFAKHLRVATRVTQL